MITLPVGIGDRMITLNGIFYDSKGNQMASALVNKNRSSLKIVTLKLMKNYTSQDLVGAKLSLIDRDKNTVQETVYINSPLDLNLSLMRRS